MLKYRFLLKFMLKLSKSKHRKTEAKQKEKTMRFYDVWTRNKTDETDASYLGCFENTNEKRALKDAWQFFKRN